MTQMAITLPLSHQQTGELIHQISDDHGFWPGTGRFGEGGRNFGEALALVHSELSEALEEHRDNNPPVWYKHTDDCEMLIASKSNPNLPCTCTPKPEGSAVEVVDAMIRCYDILHALLEDEPTSIDDVLLHKITYNASRPYKHGRNY